MKTLSIEQIKSNDYISTYEIEKDIQDNKNELISEGRKEKGQRLIGDRMSIMRADNILNTNKERKEFIGSLEQILEYRKATS